MQKQSKKYSKSRKSPSNEVSEKNDILAFIHQTCFVTVNAEDEEISEKIKLPKCGNHLKKYGHNLS